MVIVSINAQFIKLLIIVNITYHLIKIQIFIINAQFI